VHAADGVLYHFRAFLRDRNRPLRNRRGFGGVRGYLVDGHSHLVNRSGGAGNFLGLVLGCFGQVHGRGLGFLGGGSYSYRSTTNRLYQSAHLVDRVVDGVGDGTGEVLGYCGLGGQVTIGQVGQFVQQSQDRVLVLFILLLGGGQTFLGVAVQGKTDKDNNRNHGGQDGKGQGRADQTGAGLGGEVVGQSRQFGQQTLGVLEDVTCGGTNLEEVGRGFKDRVYVLGNELEQLVNRLQTIDGVFIRYAGDTHGGVAVELAVEYPAKQAGVPAETVGRDNGVFITGQYVVNGADNTLCQQRLALGQGNLLGRGAVIQQDLNDVVVFDLQLGNGFVQ